MQECGAAGACCQGQALRPSRVVAEGTFALGLGAVDLRERCGVHDRVGPERRHRSHDRLVVADIEFCVRQRDDVVMARNGAQERAPEAPTCPGDHDPHLVAPAAHVSHPLGVLAVPGDGPRQAFVERHLGRPAQLAQTLSAHAVPEVVAGSVLDERDQRLGRLPRGADAPRQLEVGELLAVTDIEDVTRLAMVAGRSCTRRPSRSRRATPAAGLPRRTRGSDDPRAPPS